MAQLKPHEREALQQRLELAQSDLKAQHRMPKGQRSERIVIDAKKRIETLGRWLS